VLVVPNDRSLQRYPSGLRDDNKQGCVVWVFFIPRITGRYILLGKDGRYDVELG
jgi:hypothetical protein